MLRHLQPSIFSGEGQNGTTPVLCSFNFHPSVAHSVTASQCPPPAAAVLPSCQAAPPQVELQQALDPAQVCTCAAPQMYCRSCNPGRTFVIQRQFAAYPSVIMFHLVFIVFGCCLRPCCSTADVWERLRDTPGLHAIYTQRQLLMPQHCQPCLTVYGSVWVCSHAGEMQNVNRTCGLQILIRAATTLQGTCARAVG